MNKKEKALKDLLSLYFETDPTNEEIEEIFSKPSQLSEKDKKTIENWKMNIKSLISKT